MFARQLLLALAAAAATFACVQANMQQLVEEEVDVLPQPLAQVVGPPARGRVYRIRAAADGRLGGPARVEPAPAAEQFGARKPNAPAKLTQPEHSPHAEHCKRHDEPSDATSIAASSPTLHLVGGPKSRPQQVDSHADRRAAAGAALPRNADEPPQAAAANASPSDDFGSQIITNRTKGE